jgi:2-keto-4-pentenoate hydratase/2-oxohepta-3-ene-1,7-dioic acid hydratase in catechol pathway
LFLAAGVLAGALQLPAQTASDQIPFKLGIFELAGRQFVGAVVRDATVIDLARANELLQRQPHWVAVPMARDMKELIGRYELDGLRQRVYQIVNEADQASRAGEAPAYVHDLETLEIRPPIMYPETMLNAARNYQAHDEEMSSRAERQAAATAEPPESIPYIWERKPGDTRHNPHLFPKPSTAIIADGENIRMPPGRDELDWECELAVVIGRPASRVGIEEANDYIFGYTIENDVSDRAGRGDGRHGSDWLIGKGHDTYAPMGPFIVPKEFIGDPMNLAIKFTLNGEVMQDSNTSFMWHNVYELVHYASNILMLRPGDVIATGSPSGVGAGLSVSAHSRTRFNEA